VSNILERILATKRDEVSAARAKRPESLLRDAIAGQPPPRDFVGAMRAKLAAGKPAVIAEIKKKSPSAGQFRDERDFDPARFAVSYEAHGAACLSVLTDGEYFGGSLGDLVAARAAVRIPVLRKDFVVDAYQVIEARAAGADAVLFIMGAIPVAAFLELEALAVSLGLAVLAESHNAVELEQALQLATPLIGINNRDLTRFVTDLDTTLRLRHRVPSDRIVVTESGIENREAIDLMKKNGVNGYLVGGAFMRAPDPGAELARLFSATP
jgi:indole-3-glycerol phosphate synthase